MRGKPGAVVKGTSCREIETLAVVGKYSRILSF